MSDLKLLQCAIPDSVYQHNMQESADIMRRKFDERRAVLDERKKEILKEAVDCYRDGRQINKDGDLDGDTAHTYKSKREKIAASYRSFTEDYCRFMLDILMYEGVTVIRQSRSEKMDFESPEVRQSTVDDIDLWLEKIHEQLYKPVRKARIDHRDMMERMSFPADPDLEDKLIKQQILIRKGWD